MTNSTKLPPPDIDTSNGMILDGVFASEVWDSSGEVLDVAGCDISDMEEGRGVANYEHRNDESEGATGQDIVGKIIYAKKILKESDATDERQKMFWRKVKVPFIYGMVRLYDGAGHLSAQGLAAQIRDHVKHDEPIIVRFSIDGSTIERKGNRLSSTLGRRVALTIKPANKTCDSGLVVDPNAPEGFEKKPMSLVKSEDPMYGRLGSGGDIEQQLPDQALLRKAAAANKQEMQARQRLLAQMAAMQAEEAAPAAPPAAKSAPASKSPAKASSGVWESEDGLVIPKHGTPERQRWDQRFMSGIQQAFGRGKPTTIDVASAMNLNGIRNYNRFNLYKEMAAAGDPLPPVVVRQTPYGVEVVDGNHRHHAAKAAGVSTMSAVDITGAQQKPMKKAMTAGGTDAAPSTLTGGAALQKEDVRRKIVSVIKAYDEKSGVSLREFMKNELPDVSDEYIDHFADLADELRAKLKKAEAPAEPSPSPSPPPTKKRGKAALAPTPGVEVGSAPGTIEADVADDDPIPAKGALTIRGKAVTPNPHVKRGKLHFNEHTGELHLPQATYKMYNPDEDGESGRHFREVWHSPEVRKQHDYAVRNWIEVNKALKEGRLPEAVLATSVAFSQLSPNTPVPVHEMMYAYLLDTFKNKGYDIRDPRFGTPETKQDWMSRDQPQNWPTSSRDYFTDQIGGLFSLKNASKRTGRKVGDRPGFMLPNDKFSNMSNYSAVHGFLRDLVERHGADTRSAVAELMKGKVSAKLWEAARQRALKTGKPDIGEYRGLNIPGLAPKTARFAYSMLGAGNSFVPDTHFSRHLFGLDKKLDGSSIGQVRDKVLWNENNSDLLNAMDRWYYRNHPSVKLMLEHPEFGQYFKDNPEQAVFPAFWGHWLSIAPHEARLGHKMANVASNQSASHRPLFDEVTRLLADPRESANAVPARTSPLPTSPATAPNAEAVYPPPKARAPRVKKSENEGDQQHDGPLIDPRVAAGLMASWVREHGEGAALFYFYTHLIPLLMHGHDKPAHDDEGHVLIKAEALSVDVAMIADALQKADAEGYSETPPQRPQKQKPRQQAAQNTHQAMLMMAGNAMKQQAGESASEAPSPPGMPSGPTWAHLVLAGKGWGGDDRAQAQAALDYYHKNKDRTLRHVPEFDKLNSSPEQRQLVDGLDLSEKNHVARPAHASDPGDHINGQWSVWATHPTLQSRVFAKGDANSYGSGAHRGAVREVAYHNLARDFFGLGDYVPTTAVGKMVNGEAWSVMMPVKDAEHYSGSQRQHDIIKALGDRGELHKLAIMNFITGNNDRHHHNYLFDKHGIKLIDHGHTFADPFARGLRVPRYLQHYERLNPHARTMHPEAAKWLDSLDSQKLTEQALRYFGPEMAGKMGMALTVYKRMYGAARSNGQLPYGLLRSINHSTDDQAMRDSMGRRLGAIDAGQVWTPMDVRKQFLRSEDKPPFWRGASFGTPDMRKRP